MFRKIRHNQRKKRISAQYICTYAHTIYLRRVTIRGSHIYNGDRENYFLAIKHLLVAHVLKVNLSFSFCRIKATHFRKTIYVYIRIYVCRYVYLKCNICSYLTVPKPAKKYNNYKYKCPSQRKFGLLNFNVRHVCSIKAEIYGNNRKYIFYNETHFWFFTPTIGRLIKNYDELNWKIVFIAHMVHTYGHLQKISHYLQNSRFFNVFFIE